MSGRAFVFGDNLSTDALAPGAYMKAPIQELAAHCLESVDPAFAATVKPGDIVVAGENAGMGSSREQAVMALRELGVRAIVANSFAGLFYRNCINLGVTPLPCAEAGKIAPGDALELDDMAGVIRNLTRKETYSCEKIPPPLRAMLDAGGLLPFLKAKLASGQVAS